MINEHTYVVGMIFISWVVAIFMLLGFLMVKATEFNLKNRKLPDEQRLALEVFINTYYSSNFTERVVMMLHYGSSMASVIFTDLFKIKRKGRQ